MDVASAVVAIIGPNEAGKSSFLRGLLQLNGTGEFAPGDATRGSDGRVCVRATFALEERDRQLLLDIPEAAEIRTIDVWKRESGRLHADVAPEIVRSIEPRLAAAKALEVVTAQKRFRDDAELQADIGSSLTVLRKQEESLAESDVATLTSLAGKLAGWEPSTAAQRNALTKLGSAIENEARPAPGALAAQRLLDERPEFLMFDEPHRALPATHTLGEKVPLALRNLTELSALDVADLVAAVDAGDEATVEELLFSANRALERIFAKCWTQANVAVRFRVTDRTLHVLVTSAPGRFISLAERSDGFRQFVALMSYVERFSARQDVVLLIDEAETHLHYNAQADFVRVLTYQELAGKVIYTTHSAGCLPEDIGVGVRLIEPTGPTDVPAGEWQHSRVENRVWGRPDLQGAYSPLLIAMGAGALAFSAARYAVVAEGLTDAMLLPTLLREVTGRPALGYQVAPGISEASAETLGALDLSAARVAYVTDGDSDGARLRQRLLDAGVPAERILKLGDSSRPLSLEDLLDPAVYLTALNAELRDRHGVAMPASSLAPFGRATAAREWLRCELGDRSVDISKRAVVQRVLDHDTAPLVAANRRRRLAALHKEITRILGIPLEA